MNTLPKQSAAEAAGRLRDDDLDRPTFFRSDTVIAFLIITGSIVLLPAAMMAPWAYLTAFPPPLPKTATQIIQEKLAAQGMAFDAESFKRGQAVFGVNCVACHTHEGGAKQGLGKDIVHSAFTSGKTDKELMMFLKTGRNPGDPMNTTGIDMPPKGGNPALSDDDLRDVIAFIRGQQAADDVKLR
jgi:disulfide bond formation protein DsbB